MVGRRTRKSCRRPRNCCMHQQECRSSAESFNGSFVCVFIIDLKLLLYIVLSKYCRREHALRQPSRLQPYPSPRTSISSCWFLGGRPHSPEHSSLVRCHIFPPPLPPYRSSRSSPSAATGHAPDSFYSNLIFFELPVVTAPSGKFLLLPANMSA